MLREAGISRDEARSEIRGGRWSALGTHTIFIGPADSDRLKGPSAHSDRLTGPSDHPDSLKGPSAHSGRLRDPAGSSGPQHNACGDWPWPRPAEWPASAAWAVWEAGSGAVLDGSSALLLAGLQHFEEGLVHVTLPHGRHLTRLPGVRVRKSRHVTPARTGGLPRVTVEAAVINAAQRAVSDRQAALLMVMPVQQGLTTGPRLLAELASRDRLHRRRFITLVLRDIADGAHALGELDFARLCRAHALPRPSRQEVRQRPNGRTYLDVWWESHRAGAEIDGAQHGWGLRAAEDSLRDNEMVIGGEAVLRIPVLLLRTDAARVMDQVARFLVSREIG